MRFELLPAVFLFAWSALWMLSRPAIARWFQDQPNERSLHRIPVPRVGGIGILAGMSAYLLASPPATAPLISLAACYAALAALSALDDRMGLPASLRLSGHLLAAAAWTASTGIGGLATLTACTVLIAGAANAYNFMDGSDGLAGAMSAFGFATYAIAASAAGDPAIAGLSGAMAVCALAFLCYNWHPATLFLGDAGSIPIGFAAASLGILGVTRGLWPWTVPVIIFFPFAFDATYTLVKRLLKGERFWQAHRDHLYQRAILRGLGHRGLAIRACTLMLLGAALALSAIRWPALGRFIIIGQVAAGFWIASQLRPTPTHQARIP